MTRYDTIVLGAGIAGLSVARELAKRGQRVLILERDEIAGRTSRAAAGILDLYTEASQETPLFRLGLKALDFYPSFLQEISRDVEYQKTGVLYLTLTPEDETLLKDRFQWQVEQKLPAQWLSKKEVKVLEPAVSDRVRGGVLYPEIAKLNADKLTQALLEAATTAGVEIRTSVKDVSVRKNGEKIEGVEVSGSLIESSSVVIATGCWAGASDGWEIGIKVHPVRGQILILRSDASIHPKRILHTLRWAYVVPWPNHRLLVGSTLESAGFNNRVTEEGKESILNRAGEMLEGIRSLPLETRWAGLRPCTDTGAPLIGPTLVSGLFLAVGYYRSGMVIGPLVGQLLAEGIITGKFSSLIQPFFPKP